MKWNNRGHEFDHVWEELNSRKKVYLFGAGEYGALVFNTLNKQEKFKQAGFTVCGFLDNNEKKQGKDYLGLTIYTPTVICPEDPDVCIVLSISPNTRKSVLGQLQQRGFVYHQNVFTMETYLSIYYAYALEKVYFPSISFLPSTRCNLNCEACLNFTPYMKKFDERPWNQIKNDIDLFFQTVDDIMLFHISGGEPMLYPHMKELVEYIGVNYREKIHVLKTVTNGTVIPKPDLLETLVKHQVVLTVDDYRESVPQSSETFAKLICTLQEQGVLYEINKVDEWIDLAPLTTNHANWSEEQLGKMFNGCHVPWQELRNGKLYSCNYSSYAIVAGLSEEHPADSFDLHTYTPSKAKELMEFRMGYNERGYVEFCKRCSGYMDINPNKVPPAKQAARKK